jgi:GT2 family glycosyltransferase
VSLSAIAPRVSVIIPAYKSQETLAACLNSLKTQTFADHESILIDSSPNGGVRELVNREFPWVRFEHSSLRLLPHAARNRGVVLSSGRLLVFTDPDVVFPPTWLARLVAAHEATGLAVVGSVSCGGSRWLDLGAHFCKFDIWLPGGHGRQVRLGPSVNMLVPRDWYDEVGGFRPDIMLGDAVFCWQLERAGRSLWFEPRAMLVHHYHATWRELVRERYARGREFSEERRRWEAWGRRRTLAAATVSVLPLRLVNFVARAGANALRAGMFMKYLSTLPVIVVGTCAWLAGELRTFGRVLVGRARP